MVFNSQELTLTFLNRKRAIIWYKDKKERLKIVTFSLYIELEKVFTRIQKPNNPRREKGEFHFYSIAFVEMKRDSLTTRFKVK